MNQQQQQMLEEIQKLLAGYEFVPADGAYLEGQTLAVEFVPVPKLGGQVGDLEFNILPIQYREQVTLKLSQQGKEVRQIVREAQTDDRGHALFKFVLMDEPCSVMVPVPPPPEPGLVPVLVSDRTKSRIVRPFETVAPVPCRASFTYSTPTWRRRIQPTVPPAPRPEAEEELALTAAAAGRGRLEPIEYFTDQRMTVELAKDSSGQLWLTFETIDPALAGASVRFEWGSARGSLQLPTGAAGQPISVKLELSEEAARACQPKFEVEQPVSQ